MDEPRKFPPTLMLTQMKQRISRNGSPYLEGRLGLAKVLLLRSNKRDENGEPVWNLCMQELPRDDAAKPAASKPSIFSAKPAPMAVAREENGKAFEFDDNVDDLWPGGRA